MLSRMALPQNKLSQTLSLIENQYVDSVAMDSLAEHVIPMLVRNSTPTRSTSPPRRWPNQRTARRRIRRHRRGIQHGHRHGDRAERHSVGAERQGGRRGGRPHRAHQRFAGGRTTDRPARDHAPAARQTRLDGAAGPRTARHRRTGGGDGRARQDPDPQPHGGTDARRRRGVRQAGAVRADHFRRIPQGAGVAARRRG